MNTLMKIVFGLMLTLASMPSVLAQENDWPRTLPLQEGMVTIYSLQVDEMRDNKIYYRAALAYRETTNAEPVFGAGWFESPVAIDTSNRIVHPTELKVTATRFPTGIADVQSELADELAQQSPKWNLDFSLDELEAALKTAEAEAGTGENLNTTPPKIIYRDHPALLISMDGEPVLREIENSPLEAVINTPYPLIFDHKHYYLNAARDIWYRADKATGPYRFDSNPPADIVALINASETDEATTYTADAITAANAPEIIVSTIPAELIVTEGPAAFVPLVDDLLVLQNSDDDVFMHVSSQNYYIVLAGRWYRSGSLAGPWNYQLADDLPTAFANIPSDSDQADSRVYVAGTEEARDAVLDAYVPQTAAVARGEVDIEVSYDGEPVYAPVDGTGLVYIENTGSTVIQSNGWYYLVEDGVWYVSSSPNGPWQVSDHRPQQVDTILPTSPVYNVKYVRVYDSTPDVVYVGYTPGYTGSYVYHNTIFYGTGWAYRPWVSPYYYYPRHSTWGFHASYNPWSGWNFGLSWGWGPFSLSYYSGGYWHHNHYWHHRHYGHWGPRGYRHRSAHHNYRQNRYSHNRYGRDRHGRGSNDHYAYDNRRSNDHERHDNLYRDRSQSARITDTRDNQPRTPGTRSSNSRQAKYVSASNARQKNYTGLKKGERNRTGPVSPADLRLKARNSAARDLSPNTRVVDSREKTSTSTRQAKYVSASNTRQKNYAGLKKGERNRTSPVSSSYSRQKANMPDANSNANLDRLLADNSGNVNRQTSRSSNPSTPVNHNSRSSRRAKNQTVTSPPGNTSARQSQTKKSVNTRQRVSPTNNTASPRVQSRSRPSPPPTSSSNQARKNSAPPKSAPQKSTQKTSQRRSGSRLNSDSSKRSSSGRHRG